MAVGGAVALSMLGLGTGRYVIEQTSASLSPPVLGTTLSPLTVAAPSLSGVLSAVVRVSTGADAGSGLVVDRSGLVLTSAHVAGDSSFVDVVFADLTRVTGRVTRLDPLRDLALIELPAGEYHWTALGASPEIRIGATVFAVGYPLALPGPPTVTRGIVSRALYESTRERQLIQTDTAINLGNSGGPIVDGEGNVLGIVTSRIQEYGSAEAVGLSFAVTAQTVYDFYSMSPEGGAP